MIKDTPEFLNDAQLHTIRLALYGVEYTKISRRLRRGSFCLRYEEPVIKVDGIPEGEYYVHFIISLLDLGLGDITKYYIDEILFEPYEDCQGDTHYEYTVYFSTVW